MGSRTFYLTKVEEAKVRKLIEQGQFPSVYAVLKTALKRFLDGYKN